MMTTGAISIEEAAWLEDVAGVLAINLALRGRMDSYSICFVKDEGALCAYFTKPEANPLYNCTERLHPEQLAYRHVFYGFSTRGRGAAARGILLLHAVHIKGLRLEDVVDYLLHRVANILTGWFSAPVISGGFKPALNVPDSNRRGPWVAELVMFRLEEDIDWTE